jgi:hypothetical protein
MAYYLNTETNEYPRHDGDLELLGWTLGEPLPEPWVEVEHVPSPEVSESENYSEGAPVHLNGVWKRNWVVRDLTEEELTQRNTPYPKEGTLFSWDSIRKEWKFIS